MSHVTITNGLLLKLGACQEERELFAELFPSGAVQVTVELCMKHADMFDWEWAGEFLLNSEGRTEFLYWYDRLLTKYNTVHAPIQTAYNLARGPIDTEYRTRSDAIRNATHNGWKAELQTVYEEHVAAIKPLIAAYDTARAPLVATFNKESARAFADAAIRYGVRQP